MTGVASVPGRADPLILTLRFDGATFAYLDDLRRRHFPPERNIVPAHLTLFHALPGRNAGEIRRVLDPLCRREAPFDLMATGFRPLGRGVAVAFTAPDLVRLRDKLRREWGPDLTAQDQARIAPHVTIQNKVSPKEARALLDALAPTFRPFTARGEGLNLWHYRGGPWELAHRFTFGGG